MKKLLLLALIASCSGRCNAPDAGVEALGPTAECRGSNAQGVFCKRGSEVWACTMDGVFSFTAKCGLLGVLVPGVEKP